MSDLNDSFEEGSSEKYSTDSLEFTEKKFSKPAPPSIRKRENKASEDDEFCCSDGSENSSESRKTLDNPNLLKRKIVLPQITNIYEDKGFKNLPLNLNIDNETLNKRGLHLNADGSFIKSHRSEEYEDLPFVNPKMRNLLYQLRKPVEIKRKAFPIKKNRKNTFTFKEDSDDQINMSLIINSRRKKDSSEEVLTSADSVPSYGRSYEKLSKNLRNPENDNLTDSMKQIIFAEQSKNTDRLTNQLKKTRSVTNLLEAIKYQKSQNFGASSPSFKLPDLKDKFSNHEKGLRKGRSKMGFPKAHYNQHRMIDIFLNKQTMTNDKTKMSYFERRQKEQGYNPLCLRLGAKNAPSDTNRSNYGDSTSCVLSEHSSRIYSNPNDSDEEDEESFYQRLIAKEKMGIQRSSRSETPLLVKKLVELPCSHSCKNQTEVKSTPTKKLVLKNPKKSTSIDLPINNHRRSRTQKNCHYCSIDSSTTISKAELAQRAKAYGIMVNARNVFRLKNQSSKKQNVTVAGNGSDIRMRTMSDLLKSDSFKRELPFAKQNPLNAPTTMGNYREQHQQHQGLQNFPRTSKSFYKPDSSKTLHEAGSFALPNYIQKEKEESKRRQEILKRMRSYIKPDISY